jgi:hypothetical protein
MKKSYVLFLILALSVVSLVAPAYGGNAIEEGSFHFKTFSVSGVTSSTTLQVETINNLGTIVGSYGPPSNAVPQVGFLREPGGNLVPISNPLSDNLYTQSYGVNDEGTVVGYYFDVPHNQYSGFFYRGGNFTTYNIPDLAPKSATTIYAINDLGAFCGFYQAAPAYVTVPYCNWFGVIDINFPIPASTFTQPVAVNNLGEVAGTWSGSDNVPHGFIRGFDGKITYVDVPGANKVANEGTVLIGLNDFGWSSGHYWDEKNYEHGFVRDPDGKFYQIDVPGALTSTANRGTSGGGINDEGVVVGHFDPKGGGGPEGYIATPADYDPFD